MELFCKRLHVLDKSLITLYITQNIGRQQSAMENIVLRFKSMLFARLANFASGRFFLFRELLLGYFLGTEQEKYFS